MKIKTILITIAFLSVLTGCITQRRCYNRFPPKSDTIKINTIRDSIIYRDTTVYIEIPGEFHVDSIMIPCPPPPPSYVPRRVYAETSLAHASAWWSYPVIKLELIQKDTTILHRLDNALKEAYHWENEFNKITTVLPPVKFVPKWIKVLASIGGLFILALIGWVVLKIVTISKK